jgi:hypothetical protein
MAVEARGAGRNVLPMPIDERLLRRSVHPREKEHASYRHYPQEQEGRSERRCQAWMLAYQR